MRRLLADCGNTAIKLAMAEDATVGAVTRLAADPAAISTWFAAQRGTALELVIAPGASATTSAVLAAAPTDLPRRIVGEDLRLPDLGQYPGCGVDRVLAGLAAGVYVREPVIVIDCGTATTLGAWWVAAPEVDRDPCAAIHFLGGVILPSASACCAGLHLLAPALPLVEPGGPEARADQHGTVQSIAAGIGIGYGPMVAACLVKLRRETGASAVLVTGGDAGLILSSRVITPDHRVDDLVLRGLALVAHLAAG